MKDSKTEIQEDIKDFMDTMSIKCQNDIKNGIDEYKSLTNDLFTQNTIKIIDLEKKINTKFSKIEKQISKIEKEFPNSKYSIVVQIIIVIVTIIVIISYIIFRNSILNL